MNGHCGSAVGQLQHTVGRLRAVLLPEGFAFQVECLGDGNGVGIKFDERPQLRTGTVDFPDSPQVTLDQRDRRQFAARASVLHVSDGQLGRNHLVGLGLFVGDRGAGWAIQPYDLE